MHAIDREGKKRGVEGGGGEGDSTRPICSGVDCWLMGPAITIVDFLPAYSPGSQVFPLSKHVSL